MISGKKEILSSTNQGLALKGCILSVAKWTVASRQWVFDINKLNCLKIKDSPHHYLTSTSLDCRTGWVCGFMLLALDCCPTICTSTGTEIHQTRLRLQLCIFVYLFSRHFYLQECHSPNVFFLLHSAN